jgi:hypothetical protein
MRVDAVVVKGGNRGSNVYMYGANEAEWLGLTRRRQAAEAR